MKHIAVIDIGKTNAKLALVDLEARAEVAVVTRPNKVLAGPPYPHFDTEGHWAFLLGGLKAFQASHGIDAVSVTTHGASGVLLAADGSLAAPVLDYECTGPDDLAADYDALRPPFAETGSARLPMGLNLGAQVHWQLAMDPTLLSRVDALLTYPQYWGFRLTGVRASDVTSLGCHTDLWNPFEARFSSLVDRLGLSGKMAPVRRCGEVLGRITPEVAAATGMAADTPVAVGLHDSNASLLPHLIDRPAPFSVVSTGTWVVCMAVGGATVELDPARDTLVNVNALGAPTPSARFMGGREYEMIRAGAAPLATADDLGAVLDEGIMLLPAVQRGSGPFPKAVARWMPDEPRSPALREVALGQYLALMTAECLGMIGAEGPVIVEGPFGQNRWFTAMLGAATGRAVVTSASQTGTAIGAALLFGGGGAPATAVPATLPDARLAKHAKAWRKAAG
ncbi:FGGY-family carbohydrate kinase [Paragemmobacter straminiformis]|uniref:FGGY-family carbohydrate kinase n=1 Tax=Paragemmobacter straminiformis TaxID=2045119 RepID=A0A842I864_9RHOB|nr:FGGY-family carbohydrate kinase [Gemmobacter straminiformis]MBC2835806.1 FGGY-family carbohydrate kinase [Gemmobacter straminiformis]